jgi:hypothetical protein
MKTLSKQEAIKLGLKRYFPNKRCAKGHLCEWFVNGKCVECNRERNKLRPKTGKTGKVASKAVVASVEPTNGGTNAALNSASGWGGLARRVKALIEKADKAADKAEQFYKSAGLTIKEIKEKYPDDWEAIVRDECGIGRSRAYELISIADGKANLAMIRANTNERQKIHKAKSQSVITDSPKVAEPPIIEPEVIEETPPPEIEAGPPAFPSKPTIYDCLPKKFLSGSARNRC